MNQVNSIILRLLITLSIIAGGCIAMKYIIDSKEDPAHIDILEQTLRVDVVKATCHDVPVSIEGYGQVRSRDIVSIAPEVPGRVVALHPKLETGEIIPANEVLFEVDPRDYQARVDDSQASLKQLENTIARLNKQLTIDTKRLETFKRSRTLAKTDFERLKSLYEKDKVGTQSQVDTAELAYNQTNDAYDQLALSLDITPNRIQEAQSALDSATAMAQLAATNLERTKVRVPFAARVKSVTVEAGQYVSPGKPILMLADDSILDISIPIDSKQARTWLEFDQTDTPTAWFENLKQVPVQVEWTEERNGALWTGQLSRIEKFDPATRTLTLLVQVHVNQAISPIRGILPLVEGMFCKVTIPGKIAQQVVQLPAECVSFGQDTQGYKTAFIAKSVPDSDEIRLDTINVLESHINGDSIFIQQGIQEGDLVVITRLINPLKDSLLDINLVETMEAD
mgnify:CR=1 FL=1